MMVARSTAPDKGSGPFPRPTADGLCAEAERLHGLGLCLVPLLAIPGQPELNKKPAWKWGRYRGARPSLRTLLRWLRRPHVGGLAVTHGAVSGGLACRDFDTLDAYRRWAAAFPHLAGSLPTVRTARGFRPYFRLGAKRYDKLDDGELIGSSAHYSILPPSVHPTGVSYSWTVPLRHPAELPLLHPEESGFLPPPMPSGPCPEETHTACVPPDIVPPPNVDNSAWRRMADAAVLATLPGGPGERNRRVFDLARHLLAIPGMRGRNPEDFRPVVERWHRMALDRGARTRNFAVTWEDFVAAWAEVKYPAGVNLAGVGQWLREMYPAGSGRVAEDAAADRLDLLCQELQRRAGDRPFFLSARVAARLIGTTRMTAHRLLRRFADGGVIECVTRAEPGVPKPGEKKPASQYRYTGGTVLPFTRTGREGGAS